MPSFAGLQTNFLTWLIMAGVTACWLLSAKLVPGWRRDGWRALLKSLYGFALLGFGLDILLRFLMLSYNAVEWGNGGLRLVAQPPETVNLGLAYCGIYWLLVSLGYAFAICRSSAGPLALTRIFTIELVYALALPTSLFCSLIFYLTDGPSNVPLTLLTPLSVLAYLYSVPATIVWWDHFQRPGPAWRIGTIPLLVLLPALIHGWRSPYRENIAPLLLIPLIAALFAGRRPALRKLIPIGLVCFLVMTSLITGYRRIKWENARADEVAVEMRGAGLVDWFTGNWGERMARFHSFDSIIMTIQLVPRAVPYSGRNVLVSPFIRGFVPRLIYADKGEADAGTRFSAGIWSYDDPLARQHSGASIAPSMPGDLYQAGGLLYIALGALIWGVVLGLVDGWKAHLPVFCAAGITALLATHCAMSIERDFDHSVAALIQTFLLLLVVAALITLARRRSPDLAVNLNPTLENS